VVILFAAGGVKDRYGKDQNNHRDHEEGGSDIHSEGSLPVEYQNNESSRKFRRLHWRKQPLTCAPDEGIV
jgi:hypothetical protein